MTESSSFVFVIGIVGASGSGKTTLSDNIVNKLLTDGYDSRDIALLGMDGFYKALTVDQKAAAYQNNYNFDSPDALDLEHFVQVLQQLKDGKTVDVPVYDFKTHSRTDEIVHISQIKILIVEVLYAF